MLFSRKCFGIAIGAITLAQGAALSAQPTAADFDQPRVWTWGGAPVDAEGRFINLVHQKLVSGSATRTGTEMADLVCDNIVSRGLGAEEIAVFIQNFGRDTPTSSAPRTEYHAHASDALPDPNIHSLTGEFVNSTIYMQNGIAEAKLWVDDFIVQYKARQAAKPAIPDPFRFHFDNELYIHKCCNWDNTLSQWTMITAGQFEKTRQRLIADLASASTSISTDGEVRIKVELNAPASGVEIILSVDLIQIVGLD